MGQIFLQIPQVGLSDSTEDPKVASDLTSIQNVINGNLDASNLATGVALLLQTTGTSRKVAFGQGSLSWSGSSPLSNTTNQPHGLGVTPVVMFAQAASSAGNAGGTVCITLGAPDATNIYVLGRDINNANPPSSPAGVFWWVAIG